MEDQQWSSRRNQHYYLIALIVAAVSLYLFFYRNFNSGFGIILGDKYDAVIESVIVSHWYHALTFTQSWNQPPYFYPHRDVLGYNDGYLIYGVIGAIYRLVGLNPLIAQSLVHITVKAIGFASMLALLTRLQGKILLNILGAALFTLSINLSTQAGHGQLLAMAFTPLLALLLMEFFRAILEKDRRVCLFYGFVFILAFNLLLITSYYIAWFFFILTMIFIASYTIFEFNRVKTIVKSIMWMPLKLAILAVSLVIMLVPFASVYLPKLKETGGHVYWHQLFHTLHPVEILNFDSGSLVWGWLHTFITSRYPYAFRPGEFTVGATPDVLIVTLLILGGLAIGRLSYLPRWMKPLGLTVVIATLLPLSFKNHSLWYFVHLFVPGASGVRTVCRFYLLLALPVTVLISVGLSGIYLSMPYGRVLSLGIMTLLCVSQINLAAPAHLDVTAIMANVERAGSAPPGCKSFFAMESGHTPQSETDRLYRVNVPAMFLADHVGIPTLNGFSTFNPPDWIFRSDAGYLQRVSEYINKHRLKNVCSYDFGKNKWDYFEPDASARSPH